MPVYLTFTFLKSKDSTYFLDFNFGQSNTGLTGIDLRKVKNTYIAGNGLFYFSSYNIDNFRNYGKLSKDGKTYSWYFLNQYPNSSEKEQLNRKDILYYWIAIGV